MGKRLDPAMLQLTLKRRSYLVTVSAKSTRSLRPRNRRSSGWLSRPR